MEAQLFYNNAKKHLFSLTADIAVLEKKLKRKRIVESLDACTTRRINAMKEGENINLLFGKRAYCIERKGDKFSMYANNIGTLGEKIYADSGKISGEKLDEASRRYAHNLARNRFWKKLLAVAYVALPPVISGSVANLFVSQKVVYAVESATQAAKTVVEQPPAQDIYTVPKGGGIWHICKAIANDKIPSFDNLSVADQNIAIDSMKDAVVANPAKYGLEPSEIIPRALEKGGPWLRLGADMHAKDLASAVPKRLMDTLGLGSHSITSASIKAAVKGATSQGDISKAVAIGHSIKR